MTTDNTADKSLRQSSSNGNIHATQVRTHGRPVTVFEDTTITNDSSESQRQQQQSTEPSCYTSLNDLTNEEHFPKAGDRHMVNPPQDQNDLVLVCCQTTVGPWSILVHPSWAPHGARRFLDMVTSNYFNVKVPLMRCVQDFLCQFGLAGSISANYASKIPDDPAWLPTGKDHRYNVETGVKRFQKGYLAYAGSGPKSRGRQLFVALEESKSLGGSLNAPWEVPWGELVGRHSYDTLDKIYTGYGENGPDQNKLTQQGAHEYVHDQFPKLDWILSCHIVDQESSSPMVATT